MRKVTGMICMALGAIFLLAALGLVIFNHEQAEQAADASDRTLPVLQTAIAERAQESRPVPGSMEATEPLEIDGEQYLGILTIPALELELPVLSDLSSAKLQLGPCRYYGTIDRDLVIAAHNYARYFGRLSELHTGDVVYLTDVSGHRHSYRVSGVEILGATAIEEMLQSGYELTLFTCTYGGAERVTVRCELAGD